MNLPGWYLAICGAILFMMSACIFSFLNVIIYRVPKKMDFIKKRSHCPGCGRVLTPLDLVPVFSYLFLRGKCRTCGAKIGLRDVCLEVFGGCLALFCAWHYWGDPLAAVTVYAFFCILVVVTVLDIDTMEIEPALCYALFVVAVISCFTMPGLTLLSRVIGFFCVSLPMFLLIQVIPGAFGGGDVRLIAAGGAFLGWKLTLLGTFFAMILGGIWGAYLLASKKKGRKDHFAFGPFLCIGMAAALLYGERILAWYLGAFGF